MRLRRVTASFCAVLIIALLAVSSVSALDGVETDVEGLQDLSTAFASRLAAGRTQLYYDLLAADTGAQSVLNADPNIQLMFIDADGLPVYYGTDNLNAARTISTDDVWPGGGAGFSLTGSGTTAGKLAIWDGGAVLSGHQEFGGRVSSGDSYGSTSTHATHVAGTMIASGVNANAKGMSNQANLVSYHWDNDSYEMANAAANGLNVSNHSYGFTTGWSGYYWYGDITVSTTEDYRFGFYSVEAQGWDQIAHNAPYYTIVKSSGNDRNDTQPAGTHYYWNPSTQSWTASTATREPDGGADGYDCISTTGTAKNIITVGAVADIPGGYTNPADVVQASFSSWGPTDDGRIKPDIVANGIQVTSCSNAGTSSYTTYDGTSMATPGISGSINLLVRQYESLNGGSTPLSSTMKAIMIQTADEAGPATGPDYQNGWGLMNTRKAAQLIADDANSTRIVAQTLTNGETDTYYVYSNGTSPLRVTLAWTDPAGTPPAASLNPTTSMLVNDLDMRLNPPGSSTNIYPYRLNPTSPASAATTGDNYRDNVEQVYVASPVAGYYKVKINHKGTLGSPQVYSLVASGTIATNVATTVYVPGNYSTIQDAVDAVYSGSTIIVRSGTYSGEGFNNINFNGKAVTVRSEWGAANTTLDLQHTERAFVFMNGEGSNSIVDGFTIKDGYGKFKLYLPYHRDGGGIIIRSSSPTIRNCIFDNCESTGGGAVGVARLYPDGDIAAPTFSNCIFKNNSATSSNGGALAFSVKAQVTLTNCTFEDNTAQAGGAAVYFAGGELAWGSITNSVFVRNTASGPGGGMFVGGPTTITGCTFAENRGSAGGGIYVGSLSAGNYLNLTETVIGNNLGGSGLYTAAVDVVNYDCNVVGANVGGDITGEQAVPTSDLEVIVSDPLFCDIESDDYQLAANSPCLAANNSCGVDIGYFGQGCPALYHGDTYWVEYTHGDDGSGDGSQGNPFRTISHAISVAADRDTILVGPGIYVENIDYQGKMLSIQGYLGPNLTLLKPQYPNSYTVTMDGGEPVGTELAGFTITEGGDTYTVYIANQAQPTIRDNIFYYNIKDVPGYNKAVIRTGSSGSDHSHPVVRDNLFYQNGGISCVAIYYGDGTIINNTFDSNNRGFLTITSHGTAKNNIVTNSTEYGLYGTWTTITDNNVWGNNPDYLGGNFDPLENISADPLYMDAAGGNYFLQSISPSVDAGEGGVDQGAFQIEYVGNGNHTTIQSAIDASSVGGFVLVYPGTYPEALDFDGKGVKVISTGGASSTNLNTPYGATTTLYLPEAVGEYNQFSGFKVTDISAFPDASLCYTGEDGRSLISDNRFEYCLYGDYDYNAAVIAAGANANQYVTHNVFFNNAGLATIAVGSGFTHIVNNTFYEDNVCVRSVASAPGLVRNNIMYTPFLDYSYGSWYDFDYNCLWDYQGAIGPHDIEADPLLNAVTMALQTGSPCINAGHPDDLYRDPNGSLSDIGAIPSDALDPLTVVHVPGDFATIQQGIIAVEDSGEVIVAAGTFTENIDFMGKTIRVIGAGNDDGDTTFLQPAVSNVPTVRIYNGEGEGTELSGFTIRNGGDTVTVWVGNGSSPLIADNIFYNNILQTSYNKCVVQCMGNGGTPVVEGNLFYNNYGISCVGIWTGAYAEIINNTMHNNARGFLTISSLGGVAKNNIVTNSTNYGVYGSTWTELDYNDFYNNSPNYANATGGPGSISADPLYVNAAAGNFHLTSQSPCIDAGDPDPEYNDPDGSRNDMGAFPTQYGNLPVRDKVADGLPDKFALHSNYPNPFNPTTTIAYDLPVASNVKLEVFNIVGQKVTTLVDTYQPAGRYEVEWGSSNVKGHLASGVYLYRLTTDGLRATKKMILLK